MISNSNEFTIDLLSNASMDVFNENTMASFRNQLSQPIHLQGEWQVALTSLSFPSNINNVNSGEIVVYKNSMTNPNESSNRSGQLRKMRTGIYNSWEDLVSEIVRIAKLKQFDRKFDMITQKLVLTFGENEGLSFQDDEIPKFPAFLVSRGHRSLHTMVLFTLVTRQTSKMGPRTLLTDILIFSLLI